MNKTISVFEEFDEKSGKNSSEKYIDFLIDNKKTFSERATNYTSLIEVEGQIEKYFFSEKGQDTNFFTVLNKLKKEIKESNVIVEDVPTSSVHYFSSGINKPQFHKEVFNVDIKACYISIAYNEGLISETFYNELLSGKKDLRLKLIGCLNSQPTIINYINGEPDNIEIKTNDFVNYYNYICYCAGAIMREIAELLKDDFLFFWVDGIYFKTEENKKLIFEVLNKYNLRYTFETLTTFEVEQGEKSFFVSYFKEYKKKTFNLPFPTLATINKKQKLKTIKNKIK